MFTEAANAAGAGGFNRRQMPEPVQKRTQKPLSNQVKLTAAPPTLTGIDPFWLRAESNTVTHGKNVIVQYNPDATAISGQSGSLCSCPDGYAYWAGNDATACENGEKSGPDMGLKCLKLLQKKLNQLIKI